MAQLEVMYNKNNILEISKCNSEELVKKYGSPLYVMNEEIIEEKCGTIKNVLKDLYPKSIVSYASKAFCCKYIYNVIKKFDFYCDVVSLGEMLTALGAKFDPSKIFFHGNNKTLNEIAFAIKNKVFNFIVDNETEYENILSFLKSNPIYKKKVNIIIRVNPGIVAHTHEFVETAKEDSKFGLNISDTDTEKFIARVYENKDVNFLGLHYHIGSQIFNKEPFVLACKKIMAFICTLKQKYNVDVNLIDIGGGFGAWYTQKDVKLQEADYKKIIKAIVFEIINAVKKYNLVEPTLVIEPGRSIVAEAGTTLYTVGNVKDIKGVRKYVSIDGGMFENPRYALYGAEYTAIKCKTNSDKLEKVTIVGKCCESGDIITKDAKLEKVKPGDIIAVLSTGAYNYTMASNYNRNLIPPVVCVKNGKSKVIVKGQTYKDLLKNDL